MKCNLKESMFLNRSEKFYKSRGIPLESLMKEYFEKSPFLATSNTLIPMVLNGHKSKFKKVFDFSMNLTNSVHIRNDPNIDLSDNDSLDIFLAYLITYNEPSTHKINQDNYMYCKFPFILREISPMFFNSDDLKYQNYFANEIYSVFISVLSDCKHPLFSTNNYLFNRSAIRFNTLGFLHYIGLFDSIIKSFESLDDNDYDCEFISVFADEHYKDKLTQDKDYNYAYEKIDESFDIIEYFNDINYNERLGFVRVDEYIMNKFNDALSDKLSVEFVAEKTISETYSILKGRSSAANNLVIWSTTENKPHIMTNGDVIQYGEKISNFTSSDVNLIKNGLNNIEVINAPFCPIQVPNINCVITKRKIHQLNFRTKDYFDTLFEAIIEFHEEFDKISTYAFSYDYKEEIFDSDQNFIQPVRGSEDKSRFNIIDFKTIKNRYDDDDSYPFRCISELCEFNVKKVVIQFQIEYNNVNCTNYIVFDDNVGSGHITKVFSPDMFHLESDSYISGGIIYDRRYDWKTGLFDLSIDNFIDEFNDIKIIRELTNVYSNYRYCLDVDTLGRFVDTNLNGVCNTDLKMGYFRELMVKKIIFGMLIQNEFDLMNLNLYESSYGMSEYFGNFQCATVEDIFKSHYSELNANRLNQLKSLHITDMHTYLKKATSSILWKKVSSRYDYSYLYNFNSSGERLHSNIIQAQLHDEDAFDCKFDDIIKFIHRQYNRNFKHPDKNMSKMLEEFDGSFESILIIIAILDQAAINTTHNTFRNVISNEAFEKFIEIEKIAIDMDFIELCKKYGLTILNPKETNSNFNAILVHAIMLINAAIYSFVYVGNNPDLYYILNSKSGYNSIIREFKDLMIEPEINFKGQI